MINHPTTLGFSVFFFFYFFFHFSFFLNSYHFAAVVAFYQAFFVWENFRERQEILTMHKQRVKRENFPLSFFHLNSSTIDERGCWCLKVGGAGPS